MSEHPTAAPQRVHLTFTEPHSTHGTLLTADLSAALVSLPGHR